MAKGLIIGAAVALRLAGEAAGFDAFPIATGPRGEFEPRVAGSLVVWCDYRNAEVTDRDIYAKDLATGVEFPVCTAPGNQLKASTDGALVVWHDIRSGESEIYGYDLSRGIEFPIYVGPGDQSRPDVSGNLVVWNDWQNGDMDIWGAYVPEPASAALLVVGLALVARRLRRARSG